MAVQQMLSPITNSGELTCGEHGCEDDDEVYMYVMDSAWWIVVTFVRD